MSERETEFKFLLSKAEYEVVLRKLNPLKTSSFVNRYFDVEGSTRRQDWVLRLRITDDSKILTLKIGKEIGPGLFDSQEYSAPVESSSPEDWAETEPLRVLRKEISQKPLVTKGEIRNTRVVAPSPIAVGNNWELDRVEFPGDEILHELEIEVLYESEQQLGKLRKMVQDWLTGSGIAVRPSTKTKFARFLEATR